MIPSNKCLAIIQSFEGYSAKAYKDPGSVNGLPITIGFGSTAYVDGRPIKMGDVITMHQGIEMLKVEMFRTGNTVNAFGVPWNQNQFDAITSFVYNIGFGAFKNSTLLKRARVNVNDRDIAAQFAKWNKNDGKVLAGLTRRRKLESDLYFTPTV